LSSNAGKKSTGSEDVMFFMTLWIAIQGLVFLYLQIFLVPGIAVWNVTPSLLLPWVIYTIWKKRFINGISVAFGIGLMFDVMAPETFGLHALIFVTIGILIDIIRQPFEADSVIAMIIAIGVSNLVYALISLLALGLLNGFDGVLVSAGAIGLAYNLLFSFGVFWVMQFLSRLRVIISHD